MRLRQLREERGLSLRDLEWLSGVRHNTIWFIESGRRKRTHRSTVIKLADALEVDVRELLKAVVIEIEPPSGSHNGRKSSRHPKR